MFNKFFFFLLLTITPLTAKEYVSSEKEFVEKLLLMIETAQAGKSELPWPGFYFSRPIIVSFDSGHLYALQLKNPDFRWQKLGNKIFYSPTDHWGIGQIPFSPYHPLGQEQVMLFHMRQPDNKGLFVIAHESFHLHQFAHFPAPSLSGYCDQMNAANLTLLEVEEAVLADLLGETNFQIEILKDFIAVNQTRYLFISPSSVQWEQHQQLMEGLADYSAYRLLEAANIAWADWPHDALIKPIDCLCDYAMKWRHYAMGAALGMLLDHLNVPRWREQTESTGKSPGEWLSETIALSASEVQERLEIARLKYHHSDIEGVVVKEVETYAQELESHMANHSKSPGTLIRLGSLPMQGGSGGGRNARSLTLPEGGTLSILDNSTAISDDQTWKLKLVNIAHLFQLEDGIREFKLDQATEMVIDGKKVGLQHLALIPSKRDFRHLQWSGKHGEFTSNGHDGTLEVDVHGTVTIRFLPHHQS